MESMGDRQNSVWSVGSKARPIRHDQRTSPTPKYRVRCIKNDNRDDKHNKEGKITIVTIARRGRIAAPPNRRTVRQVTTHGRIKRNMQSKPRNVTMTQHMTQY